MFPRIKRLRAIQSDYEPVYPYDKEQFVISAPFVNTLKGLTTDPPGFIAIKAKLPLTFDNDGNLEIVGGSNIVVNVNTAKGLTKVSDTIEAKVTAPIVFDDQGNISLDKTFLAPDETKGISEKDNKLMAKIAPPIIFDAQGNITLNSGEFAKPFTVDSLKGLLMSSNKIEIKISNPLIFDSSGNLTLDQTLLPPAITANENKGLRVVSNSIEAKLASPIVFDNSGNISLHDSSTYAKTNVNNQFLTSQTIDGDVAANKFIVSSNNLSDIGGGIGIGFGSAIGYIVPVDGTNKNLRFSGFPGRGKFDLDMSLTSRIMNVKSPESDTDAVNKQYCDSTYIKKGSNSTSNGPVLNLTQEGNTVPLVSFNNTENTRLGYVGLGPEGSLDTYLQGANNVYLQSLRSDGQIVAKNKILYAGPEYCTLGNGIMFFKSKDEFCYLGGATSNLSLKLSPPGAQNQRITTIDLESASRITNLQEPAAVTDAISLNILRKYGCHGMLWTGGRPTVNCKISNNSVYNLRLGLSLASSGGMVTGSLFVEGTGEYATFGGFKQSQVVIKLNFNSDGSLKTNCDLLFSNWGYRYGENVNLNVPLGVNLKAFMPNYLQYPYNGSTIARNTIVKKVYLDASLSFTVFIKFNHEPTGYSIWFVFDGISDPGLRNRNFSLPTINFNYVNDFFN